MDRILIIEDNRDVNEMLRETLILEGHETISVYDGAAGLKEMQEGSYDLVLLDIMLPYISGDQVLREILKSSDIPVIIISAKDITGTKIDLLKLGADDYITKPFDLGETAARVSTNLRRAKRQHAANQIIKYKEIELDIGFKQIRAAGKPLELTAKEYQILELLLLNPDKVFSKANIYESIWQEEYLGDDNAVKTHISNLRNKLKKAGEDEEYIETVWGLGYRLYRD